MFSENANINKYYAFKEYIDDIVSVILQSLFKIRLV